MTIGAWVIFGFLAVLIIVFDAIIMVSLDTGTQKALAFIVAIILILGMLIGMRWWFKNTASGQRALTDEQSNLKNGIERVITVYTADGKELAHYEGKIDIEANDGGYIKFDYEGKRYIYYNCFVESIAEIP